MANTKKQAVFGEYCITMDDTGAIQVYKTYSNTKGALREIAEEAGFTFDPDWTTRQFGTKLIDHLNS